MHKGNCADAAKLVADYLLKYDAHLYKRAPVHLPPICPYKLQQACIDAGCSAASLDAWANEEFALLPIIAFKLIANLLNRIEHEGQWPDELAYAKAVFLHKSDPAEAGPMTSVS